MIEHAHGRAFVSVATTHGAVSIMVDRSAFTLGMGVARDLAKALTACIARHDRLTSPPAKAPETPPTAPPSGWVEPARLAA